MTQLHASVGRGGRNRKTDVRLIQGLLNNYKIPNISIALKIDGEIGRKTYQRIETFQKVVLHFKNPDGRIDPNGQTFTKLINRPHSKFATALTVSAKAINLLQLIEGLATKPYDDQTGKSISQWVKGATIGYGHLILKREWNQYKNGLSKADALALFHADLLPYANKIKDSVNSKILQNEFDALLILTFNIGKTAFGRSSVLRLVNNPGSNTAFSSLEEAWQVWNMSQGKYSRGLANRRKTEWAIYSKNVYKKW